MNVSESLAKWYKSNKRFLPWRESGNPYYIWISEIILQQTRVQQGLDYYQRFIHRFPTVFILSESSLEQVLKIWQGLGYYSRARNLYRTARIIVSEYNGIIPRDYHLLLKLPGIGEYTAGAIASLAYNQPFPAIDGNVYRVLARYFGIENSTDTAKAKKEFYRVALSILDRNDPGRHNQAMIELGALICLPRNPHCSGCPISDSCYANLKNRTNELPVKKKQIASLHRYFYYLVIRKGDSLFIKQRSDNDIWAMLYDFPLIERNHLLTIPEELLTSDEWKQLFRGKNISIRKISSEIKHQLSHQIIHAWFVEIEAGNHFVYDSAIEIKNRQLEDFPMSRLMEIYLEGK